VWDEFKETSTNGVFHCVPDFWKNISTVWLEYKNEKGEVKQLKLKVDKDSLSVNDPDAKGKPSAMNIDTGLRKITVFMPKKRPKTGRPVLRSAEQR